MKKEKRLETRPSSIDADEQVAEIKFNIDEISKKSTELVVKDNESQTVASDMRIQIKTFQKRLKERLNWFIEPSQTFVKMMKNSFDLIFNKLDSADDNLENKMVMFHEEQERLLREEQEKLVKKNEKLMAKGKVPVPVPDAIETSVQSEEGKVIFTKAWTFSIEKDTDVPREYCSPDTVKIRQAIQQGIRNIAGVRIFEETRTTRR
jgi:predicted nuclease with TOPRIM domain